MPKDPSKRSAFVSIILKFVGQSKDEGTIETFSQGELTLDIPILDQYIHILAVKQKACWYLQDCSLVLNMSDFELVNGEIL